MSSIIYHWLNVCACLHVNVRKMCNVFTYVWKCLLNWFCNNIVRLFSFLYHCCFSYGTCTLLFLCIYIYIIMYVCIPLICMMWLLCVHQWTAIANLGICISLAAVSGCTPTADKLQSLLPWGTLSYSETRHKWPGHCHHVNVIIIIIMTCFSLPLARTTWIAHGTLTWATNLKLFNQVPLKQ